MCWCEHHRFLTCYHHHVMPPHLVVAPQGLPCLANDCVRSRAGTLARPWVLYNLNLLSSSLPPLTMTTSPRPTWIWRSAPLPALNCMSNSWMSFCWKSRSRLLERQSAQLIVYSRICGRRYSCTTIYLYTKYFNISHDLVCQQSVVHHEQQSYLITHF